jgi:hypothetical protein
MTDLSLTLLSAASAMMAMTILCLAALRGWSQWIALKRHEMDLPAATATHSGGPDIVNAASRIDIADLRERVRKLEAIAAGVDL